MQNLALYSTIPISFMVESVLVVELREQGLGGIVLREERIPKPYVKDYDVEDGEGPTRWLSRFNTEKWRILLAKEGKTPVGGAIVLAQSPEIHMLKNRDDLALLWDIRIQPELRRQGTGTRLFQKAVEWAKAQKCRQLAIETQNINLPACRFYIRQGCHLGEIDRFKYASNPATAHEDMLVWYHAI